MPFTNEEIDFEFSSRNYREEQVAMQQCECCGVRVPINTLQSAIIYREWPFTYMRGEVCECCARVCPNCDEYFAVTTRYTDHYCPRCREEERERERESEYYDDDDGEEWFYPRFQLFGKGPKRFGLELEIEVNRGLRYDKLRELKKLFGDFASLKDDGSLDYGIEIATMPASMEEQKKRWMPFFSNIPKGLRSRKAESCGLHIHVTREPLTDLAIAKTVCFVNANHNRRFIAIVAGRPACSYCKIRPKKIGTAAKFNSDRYEAVNLQNDETIEFRLFKGTLRQASVFKALEFTDSLTAYCAQAARSIRDSQSRVKFISFVHENAAQWPNLCAFIDAKWLGRETDLTKAIGY